MRCKCTVVEKNEFPTFVKNASGAHEKIAGAKIKLVPVYESAPGVDGQACVENKIFGDATPSGLIELTILNEAASASLKTGKDYYVDFTPVD